jgi:aryl-alcohol dehydrogenase-like predicted oxidoreductase
VEQRPLGTSECQVSRLSLGSWRTYERIRREDGLAVMHAARDAGITFLDDARYNDETGTAPISTGYSEIVFGELFRAAGWPRDETVVSNKLWWEFWPEQTPAQELDGSLGRMGFDHVDLIYTERPPDDLSLEEFVASVTGLIAAGKARHWGVLNWPAPLVRDAAAVAARDGLPPMVANQLPYSLVVRGIVEDPAMVDAMARAGASVVASFVLAGGILSGKYVADAGTAGRARDTLDHTRALPAVAAARDLSALAADLDADAATLAVAFALLHSSVATVLFGATNPAQVRQNVAALALLDRLDTDAVTRLRTIGS